MEYRGLGRRLGASLGLADRARELEGAFPVRKPAIKLRLFHSEQDFLEPGARRHTHAFKVIPRYQPRGVHLIGRGLP